MSIYDMIKSDITQEYYVKNYSNDGQRFIAWYLRNIYGLDTLEARSCITDGADDKQIDAVYVCDKDETVYIIQGKFIHKDKIDAKPLIEILSSWLHINDLQALQESSNDKLSSKINGISSALDDEYDICFELVTTTGLTKATQKELEHLRQELSDNDTLSANLVLVDESTLTSRYNDSLNISGPDINHTFTLEPGRYMALAINGTRAVIAVISLNECVNIPNINDGALFRKNVRQALSKTTKVNKDIAQTLRKSPDEFFFLNNGITSICSSLEIHDDVLEVRGLSVVNGCQSLTAIYNNSEAVKNSEGGCVIFRFYEISDISRADTISTSTNSQNAVKARDLRGNDRYILALKKSYEHCYPDGQFITKRGEKAEGNKNQLHVLDLSTLGKMLISWHIQRPSETHLESEIFSIWFNLLFHRQYAPEKAQALNEIYKAIYEKWEPKNSNPLELNDALFSQKAHGPYWHLFAVSIILCQANNAKSEMIPSPYAALRTIKENSALEDIVELAGYCTNDAFMDSMYEVQDAGGVFNPPNWFKSGRSILSVRSAVNKRLKPSSPEEKKHISALKDKLKMSSSEFEPLWARN